jgi:hypothetical protein
MPEFAEFASTTVSWSTNGRMVIEVEDIPVWRNTGTPLLRVRIDPCGSSGMRFQLRRVILSDK